MNVSEITLLKQWLTNEELRLASRVDLCTANLRLDGSYNAALRLAQALGEYRSFVKFMRSLDCLLHLFP